jgi:hypothetical protein
MKKILLIAGCSHAAGAEIDGTMDSPYNRKSCFGSVLADKLERIPINLALHGASNSTIARSVLNWFNNEYDADTMEVSVVVSWTESSRLEVGVERGYGYNTEGGSPNADWFDPTANSYYRVNFGWTGGDDYEKAITPSYHRFMAENSTMLEIWAANFVLQLQYFFKWKNIPYVMCDSMHMFTLTDKFVKQYVDLIDSDHYFNLNKGDDETFYWRYTNMGFKNPKAKYWHHNEVPHALYAEELHNFIKELPCSTG